MEPLPDPRELYGDDVDAVLEQLGREECERCFAPEVCRASTGAGECQRCGALTAPPVTCPAPRKSAHTSAA